ncbi:hypothetical protein SDC9_209851 [bioreactor metagenome]|uniref:Uncharacterized protein n=1 Tax=bioreactor metagenome TaxID=1076179 RepID=A0A645JEI1_9ZZZZ
MAYALQVACGRPLVQHVHPAEQVERNRSVAVGLNHSGQNRRVAHIERIFDQKVEALRHFFVQRPVERAQTALKALALLLRVVKAILIPVSLFPFVVGENLQPGKFACEQPGPMALARAGAAGDDNQVVHGVVPPHSEKPRPSRVTRSSTGRANRNRSRYTLKYWL